MKNQKLTEENKSFEAKLKKVKNTNSQWINLNFKLEEMVQMKQQKIDEAETENIVLMHEMKVSVFMFNF
jgi:hypothetical protein